MTDADLGTIERADDGIALRYERRFCHPREKVWRAITESDHLQHWMPTDIVGERRAGAPIELPFWPAHVERYEISTPLLTGRIEVWDPPSVFEWWWDTDRLRFELTDDGAGTLLRFTTWISPQEYGAEQTAAGYHVCLDNLTALLDTGSAPPLVDADVAPFEVVYRKQVEALSS